MGIFSGKKDEPVGGSVPGNLTGWTEISWGMLEDLTVIENHRGNIFTGLRE